jgi:hypothetical protein
MLQLLPTWLRQLRVVARDIEPLGLLVLVRVNEFVCQVLVGRIFSHLDASPSDYSWVVGAWLRLHTEELPEQDPVGLDPHKGFAEMYKDGDVKNSIRVQVQVLDTVVLKEALKKSLAGSANSRSTNLANMGTSSGFFSMGYGSPAAACHISISFSRRNPLFTRANRSSVFILDFFHSLAGLGCGGDVDGDYPWVDPSTSLRDLFFLAPAFEPLDGDGFILQVHGVFTHILSGATLVASGGGAR